LTAPSEGPELKLQMAKNSLFATLLRSPWWVSLAIAAVLALLAGALLPSDYRAAGALSTLPFVVIALLAARRQWHLPSAARVTETVEAVGTMAWPAFADLLETAFRRDGYRVQRGTAAAVDFELERQGRKMLVCARRWKSARRLQRAQRVEAGARRARGARRALHRPG